MRQLLFARGCLHMVHASNSPALNCHAPCVWGPLAFGASGTPTIWSAIITTATHESRMSCSAGWADAARKDATEMLAGCAAMHLSSRSM